jgi:hypothetical protein
MTKDSGPVRCMYIFWNSCPFPFTRVATVTRQSSEILCLPPAYFRDWSVPALEGQPILTAGEGVIYPNGVLL